MRLAGCSAGHGCTATWLARTAGVQGLLLVQLATTLVLGGVLLFVRRLLARYVLPDRAAARRYVLLALCFVLFPLPLQDFGQREHLVLAMLLPGLVITIGRPGSARIHSADAVVSGVLSGLALAIKPYFVLAWLAVEGWRRLADRRRRWELTPEVGAGLATAAAYVVAVVVLTPDYLPLVARLRPAYLNYLRVPALNLVLLGPGAAVLMFVLLAVAAVRRSPGAAARGILGIGALACFIVEVAQQKGLRYEFFPSFALSVLVLGAVAALPTGPLRLSGRLYVRLSRCLLAAICVVTIGSRLRDADGGDQAYQERRAGFLDLVQMVRARAGREPIGMLSYYMGSAFPLVNYAGVGLASRFPCLWILPATYDAELWGGEPVRYHAPPEMRPAERMLNSAVAEDLLGARPRLLVILRPLPDERRYGYRRLNYLAYFARQPGLARLFAQYQLVATQGEYDIYQRVGPGQARAGPPPSPVVPAAGPDRRPERRPRIDPVLIAGIAAFLLAGLASLRLERGIKASP